MFGFGSQHDYEKGYEDGFEGIPPQPKHPDTADLFDELFNDSDGEEAREREYQEGYEDGQEDSNSRQM